MTQAPERPRWLTQHFMAEAHIPMFVRNLRLSEYKPRTESQANALVIAQHWVDHFADYCVTKFRPLDEYPKNRALMGRGLAFIGPPGTGKTHLAALVIQEVLLWVPSRTRLEGFFLAHADLIKDMADLAYRVDPTDEAAVLRRMEIEEIVSQLTEVPLLALDDVGKERRTGSGFAEDHTDRILRSRHMNALPSIITSNRAEEKDWDIYGASMQSFMQRAFILVDMGED